MSNDMKLIMESWRSKMLLQELDVNQIPATWGMLAGLIKTMIGAKQGLTGKALATFSGLTGLFGSADGGASDAAEIADAFVSLFEENKKKPLNEVIALGTVMLGLKVLGGVSTAKKTFDFGKKVFNKLRGMDTDETDSNKFLDLMNLDPEYSKIIDDRVEEAFLKFWLDDISNKNQDDPIQDGEIDVNKKMQEFLKSKFSNRFTTGHDEASSAQPALTMGDIKTKTKKAKGKKVVAGASDQL
tara:strand:- start:2205 stop:2930 length:726 start_codon:yes stop_codon:yes gene_type:complete